VIIVGGYARISVAESVRETSIDNQIKDIKRFCEDRNYKIYKFYLDDGRSGDINKKRPAFEEMKQDCKNRTINMIVFTRLDRLARYQEIEDEIKRWYYLLQVRLWELSSGEIIPPKRRFERKAKAMISAEYIEDLRDKARQLHERKAKENLPTSRPPIGYKHYINENNEKTWVVDEEKANIVREVFRLFSEKKSIKEICNQLNINPQLCRYMIRNKTYIGVLTYVEKETIRDYDGKKVTVEIAKHEYKGIPAIVDDKTFNKVQRRLNKKVLPKFVKRFLANEEIQSKR